MFWHCWKKGCRARTQTNINIDIDDQNIQIFNEPNHNHPVVDKLIESTAIKDQMVRAIRADPTRPVKHIYDEIVERDSNIEVENIPQFNSVQSILARNRALLMPANPGSVENAIIPDEYMFSWDNEQFLSHQDNDGGILIYVEFE